MNKYFEMRKNIFNVVGESCVHCGNTCLAHLELDHIDASQKKYKNITLDTLDEEKSNLQTLCGRCHRIKTFQERQYPTKMTRYKLCKKKKQDIILKIKRKIGKCQCCGWTHSTDEYFGCACDFDHLYDKVKQVSNLVDCSIETCYKEIYKTRLLCRNCHQIHTNLQKNSKILNFTLSIEELNTYKQILQNPENNIKFQREVKNAVEHVILEIKNTKINRFSKFKKIPSLPHLIIDPNGKIYSNLINKMIVINTKTKFDSIIISVLNRNKVIYVHNLLAEVFIPNPECLQTVHHKDGNTKNNALSNLEWCNLICRKYKQKIVQVDCKGTDIKIFECIVDAAKEIGVSPSGINRCCQGKSKLSGGFRWRYYDNKT